MHDDDDGGGGEGVRVVHLANQGHIDLPCAKGGERACNSRTACVEGEMLAVTDNHVMTSNRDLP